MNTNLEKFNQTTMSSREIAKLTAKPHNDVLKAIRAMEPAWIKTTGGNFSLSEYKDSTGRTLPMYELTKIESLYVATKFNDEARAKLVIRWQELELKETFVIPNFNDPVKAARAWADAKENEQKALLLLENKTQQLDQAKEWFTIKRYAKLHMLNWRNIKWRALKAISNEHGYAVKKIFDANYGEVNIYHIHVFNIYFS